MNPPVTIQQSSQAGIPALSEKSDYSGATVAFFIPKELAQRLALKIPGALPASDLHITLAYLPNFEAKKGIRLRATVRALARQLRPLSGQLNGLARFNAEDEAGNTPIVVLPDLPDLPEARQLICDTLRKNGFYPARTHGYIPHITVAYIPSDSPAPARGVKKAPMHIPSLSVAIGDDRYHYPLTGTYPIITKAGYDLGERQGFQNDELEQIIKGGPTSGNFGHKGRPGKHGGSMSGGGHGKLGVKRPVTRKKIDTAKKKAAKKAATSGSGGKPGNKKKTGTKNKLSTNKIVDSGPDNATDFRSYLLNESHAGRITTAQAKEADKEFKRRQKADKSKKPPAKKGSSATQNLIDKGPDTPKAFRNYLANEIMAGRVSLPQAQEAMQAKFSGRGTSGKPKSGGKPGSGKPRLFTDDDFKSGQDVKGWDSWQSKLSKRERQAFLAYQTESFDAKGNNHFSVINDSLRGTGAYKGKATAETRSTIKALDSAIKKGRVPEDTQVFRGMDPSLFSGLKPGDTFTDKGYTSTTLNKKVASDFSKKGLVSIAVPKGASAGYMDSLRFSKNQSRSEQDFWFDKNVERELVLPRGSRFRVKSIDDSKNPTDVQLELIP